MSIPILESGPRYPLLRNDFLIAAVIAIAASGLTFALAYSLGWLTGAPNWFEVGAATLNYGATYLSIKQRRFAYTLGFLASAGWAVAYYQYNLLGSAILSLYLVGQLVYGYFRWGPDGKSRPVHRFEWKWWWAYGLATVLTYLGAVGIITLFGGSFAFWDGAILVLTILAQFLLDNKVLASWYVWGAVNIIGVVLYSTAGAPFAAVQQFVFGIANIWGYLAWKKSMQISGENFSETPLNPELPKQKNGLLFTEPVVDEIPLDDVSKSDLKRIVGQMEITGTAQKDHPYKFDVSETIHIVAGQDPSKLAGEAGFWSRLTPEGEVVVIPPSKEEIDLIPGTRYVLVDEIPVDDLPALALDPEGNMTIISGKLPSEDSPLWHTKEETDTE